MHYIRGAFSVASQYYKDLPAINPSTLTGAIDVVVVERPTSDGATELACSPFHVRFGKWQVLRPGDRKVNVLLNGSPIPFNMKIGEAGEAFWIFETDEDVPEDLITSPLLEATRPRPAQQPNVGPFAADSRDSESQAECVTEMVDQSKGAHSALEDEPDFLDLDAPPTRHRPVPLNMSALSATRPVSTDSASAMSQSDSKPVLSHAADTGKAVAHVLPSEIEQNVARDGDVPDALANEPQLTGAHTASSDGTGNQLGQPPMVQHENGVALDVSGYHTRGRSDRTAVDTTEHYNGSRTQAELEAELFGTSPASSSGILLVSNAPLMGSHISPSSTRPSSPSFGSQPPGARSAPSLLGHTASDMSSTTPAASPEYQWDWGAFPLRTPMIVDPSQTPFPFSVNVDRSASLPPETSLLPNSSASLLELGRLSAGATDSLLLSIEDKTFEIELSLCGRLQTTVQGDSQPFLDHKVSAQRFFDDQAIIQSRKLVIRWRNKYICREDDSPLFFALAHWREVTLGKQPTKPIDDEPYSSSDEREASRDLRPTFVPFSRTSSTWSRWWRSSRQTYDRSTTSATTAPVAPDQVRPVLKGTTSAPANVDRPTVEAGSPRLVPTSPPAPHDSLVRKFVKTLRLTSEQLRELKLKRGMNTITFSLSVTGAVACNARVFLWDSTDLIVVSDIDGTITKSDALGHVMTLMGRDWTHSGVAKLYTDICRNGYKILYLTSRAIGQAGSTRHYLKGINQDNYQLPEGPVIMSPDRLFTSLHREVIIKRPELFKMACLQDIQRLFGARNPFYSGFGNRITDAASYLKVDIPKARIFTIEYSGEVKMELLERSGFKSSYIHMTELVDQMFPPVHLSVSPQFTDLNYWRAPMAVVSLPDLAPPSPTLSARSDGSRLGRLTSAISLLSSRSRSPASGAHSRQVSPERNSGAILPLHMQDVQESLARLADEEYLARVSKRRSMDSMPGSLSSSLRREWEMHTRLDEDDEQDGDERAENEDEEGEEEEEEEEEGEGGDQDHTFDDDLLATGEMEHVPYL